MQNFFCQTHIAKSEQIKKKKLIFLRTWSTRKIYSTILSGSRIEMHKQISKKCKKKTYVRDNYQEEAEI